MLKDLAKYHTEWIKMVRSLGGDDFTEDIVQEMYLKIHNKQYNIYNNKKEVNKFYVYLTLRSILMSYFKERSKVSKLPIDDYIHLEDDNTIEENIAFNEFTLKVDEEVSKWHWYDRDLFELYRHSGLSIRKIADKTEISWVSIFHTLKDCKGKIKECLENDYKNYKNEIR